MKTKHTTVLTLVPLLLAYPASAQTGDAATLLDEYLDAALEEGVPGADELAPVEASAATPQVLRRLACPLAERTHRLVYERLVAAGLREAAAFRVDHLTPLRAAGLLLRERLLSEALSYDEIETEASPETLDGIVQALDSMDALYAVCAESDGSMPASGVFTGDVGRAVPTLLAGATLAGLAEGHARRELLEIHRWLARQLARRS